MTGGLSITYMENTGSAFNFVAVPGSLSYECLAVGDVGMREKSSSCEGLRALYHSLQPVCACASDGDGQVDVVSSGPGTGVMLWKYSPALPTKFSGSSIALLTYPLFVALGDVDGDNDTGEVVQLSLAKYHLSYVHAEHGVLKWSGFVVLRDPAPPPQLPSPQMW
jgi:hypothetical protein